MLRFAIYFMKPPLTRWPSQIPKPKNWIKGRLSIIVVDNDIECV